MMKSLETTWTVVDWWRYDAEPPEPQEPSGAVVTLDGVEYDTVPRLDPAWVRQHLRHGAAIYDSERDITYRATLDPETGEIDHLEVEADGWVGSSLSIPSARIRRAVAVHLLGRTDQSEDTLTITPEGALDAPSSAEKKSKRSPTSEELADFLEQQPGRGRQEVAARYGQPGKPVPLPTVDRWLAKARRELPDRMPPITQGKRTDSAQDRPRGRRTAKNHEPPQRVKNSDGTLSSDQGERENRNEQENREPHSATRERAEGVRVVSGTAGECP
jgi:hypothetical protein